ncbi:hypothetical protein AWC18_20540 [Mycolicibacter nonchromogenicus]|uniref:2TM domain-containing protein n=1 Tax=Mycolicibacter nonchromogenicus TaxID=1782 RepID=A0A1X1YUL4_MYCNO|nr:DUF1707 domain-containing protein [Mycolicibacter nonchromogenicus]ORW14798.1 hypothetical protein AWC18_20540 [Mycolicibacter nonchromogenicus]
MTTDTSGSAVRVGDSERESTADQLGQAFTQGYLSMHEYETRLTRAFEAQTAGALQDLVADLPVAQIVRADPRRRAQRDAAARRGVRIHLSAYLAVSVLMIGIWLVTAMFAGAWYFWPVWPILGWGIGIISHAVPVGACARKVLSTN